MKIAIVHDWLITLAGAEKVLEQLLRLYPSADLYCVTDHLPINDRKFLDAHNITTTFIHRLPYSKKMYRLYLPLMPHAIEQLNLKQYDLIISSSHAVAKGILTSPTQCHISYVHSPMRYAWDMQHDYLQDAKPNFAKRIIMNALLNKLRAWDTLTANRVDHFISNSNFIAQRIWRAYRREATTIYPPVELDMFKLCTKKDDYYITASRLVSYKKVHHLIEAFRAMPTRQLLIIGSGPEYKKLEKNLPKNVQLLGRLPRKQFIFYLQRAKAFVYAAEEDFGIALVEAQACGTPVITYGKGGALETVKNYTEHEKAPTGIFYNEQHPQSIKKAIDKFETITHLFEPEAIRQHAEQFSAQAFRQNIQAFITSATHQTKKEHVHI